MAAARRTKVEEAQDLGENEDLTQGLDEAGRDDALSSQAHAVDDAELELSRKVARRLGWVPKEEWKRNPERWVEATDFLESHAQKLSELKDQSERSNRAAAAAIDETRRQALQDAEAKLRAATQAQDEDAALAASREIAKNSGPPKVVQDWVARNPWMETYPRAARLAKAVCDDLAAQGFSMSEQLDGAETEVREAFPDLFGARREAVTEVRLSEARKVPQVESGSRTGGGARSKEKGFTDLPKAARDAFERHFAKRGVTPEGYAKSYWANQATG